MSDARSLSFISSVCVYYGGRSERAGSYNTRIRDECAMVATSGDAEMRHWFPKRVMHPSLIYFSVGKRRIVMSAEN
jgi:hypothetical protein